MNAFHHNSSLFLVFLPKTSFNFKGNKSYHLGTHIKQPSMPHRKSTFETIFQMAGMFVIYAIQVPLWNHMNHMNQVGYDWLIQSLGDRGFFEAEASMILYAVPNIKYWPLSYQLYYCSFQICCHLLLSPSITVMLLSHVDISSTRERDDATKKLCVNERRFTLGHRLSSCVNITRIRCDISVITFYLRVVSYIMWCMYIQVYYRGYHQI